MNLDEQSTLNATPNVFDLRSELVAQNVRFWGKDSIVTPALVTEVLGDGRQVIFFTPLATRPNWYIVRVDSSWNDHNWARASDFICSHTDEIYDAIQDQYGKSYYEEDDGEEDIDEPLPFPALDDSSGCAWGVLTVLEPNTICIIPDNYRQYATEDSLWRCGEFAALAAVRGDR